MDSDKKIFGDKNLSDLFEEIYKNSKQTKTKVSALIASLQPLVENIGDATLLVPMIKDYMDIGLKNDEHLIKLATVIQRLESATAKGAGDAEFDFSGLQDLLEESEDAQKELEDLNENQKDDIK